MDKTITEIQKMLDEEPIESNLLKWVEKVGNYLKCPQ
jgi:hypothetical protein